MTDAEDDKLNQIFEELTLFHTETTDNFRDVRIRVLGLEEREREHLRRHPDGGGNGEGNLRRTGIAATVGAFLAGIFVTISNKLFG